MLIVDANPTKNLIRGW